MLSPGPTDRQFLPTETRHRRTDAREPRQRSPHWALLQNLLADREKKYVDTSDILTNCSHAFSELRRTPSYDLGGPLHHRTRPGTHSGACGATSSRDRHTRIASNTRHRLLPRPNRAKSSVRHMRSTTRRYPESPGALPEPNAATSTSHELTCEEHRSAAVQ